MPNKKQEFFTSRLGLILSMIGVAVGAGNIWRFSRIVAQNGGGSFIIPWIIFLFIWSIPLIIAEIAMGKLTRKAPIGALATTAGKKFGWMGAFIALVATGILFYYSVVVGWGLRYFYFSMTGALNQSADYANLWNNYIHSYQPLFTHIIAVLIGCFIIYKGIAKGIEKTNKFLIPILIFLILIIAVRAITLPGAWDGVLFLFTPNLSDLFNYKVWLEALTQNAWDTGAGWGLLLVYSGYTRRNESITTNACLTAFSNNAISLIMGVIIFGTIFALESHEGVASLISGTGSSNTGLTFIYLPQIFTMLPGGPAVHKAFSMMFFFAFTAAALSSMISMIQLTAQTFSELGLSRKTALVVTGTLSIVLGAPSALRMAFFENQDWVWSLGLIASGLFISFGVIRYGVDKYRREVINTSPSDFKLGKFYNVLIGILIPLQAIILIGWYFFQSITQFDSDGWWNPLHVFSAGTIILQWGTGLILFLFLNKWMVKKSLNLEK